MSVNQIMLDAMQIVAHSEVANIQYDITDKYEIIDDSKRDDGIYLVSNSDISFNAYSEQGRYRNGQFVLVTIPKGDYSQTPVIIGRAQEDSGQEVLYTSLRDSIIEDAYIYPLLQNEQNVKIFPRISNNIGDNSKYYHFTDQDKFLCFDSYDAQSCSLVNWKNTQGNSVFKYSADQNSLFSKDNKTFNNTIPFILVDYVDEDFYVPCPLETAFGFDTETFSEKHFKAIAEVIAQNWLVSNLEYYSSMVLYEEIRADDVAPMSIGVISMAEEGLILDNLPELVIYCDNNGNYTFSESFILKASFAVNDPEAVKIVKKQENDLWVKDEDEEISFTTIFNAPDSIVQFNNIPCFLAIETSFEQSYLIARDENNEIIYNRQIVIDEDVFNLEHILGSDVNKESKIWVVDVKDKDSEVTRKETRYPIQPQALDTSFFDPYYTKIYFSMKARWNLAKEDFYNRIAGTFGANINFFTFTPQSKDQTYLKAYEVFQKYCLEAEKDRFEDLDSEELIYNDYKFSISKINLDQKQFQGNEYGRSDFIPIEQLYDITTNFTNIVGYTGYVYALDDFTYITDYGNIEDFYSIPNPPANDEGYINKTLIDRTYSGEDVTIDFQSALQAVRPIESTELVGNYLELIDLSIIFGYSQDDYNEDTFLISSDYDRSTWNTKNSIDNTFFIKGKWVVYDEDAERYVIKQERFNSDNYTEDKFEHDCLFDTSRELMNDGYSVKWFYSDLSRSGEVENEQAGAGWFELKDLPEYVLTDDELIGIGAHNREIDYSLPEELRDENNNIIAGNFTSISKTASWGDFINISTDISQDNESAQVAYSIASASFFPVIPDSGDIFDMILEILKKLSESFFERGLLRLYRQQLFSATFCPVWLFNNTSNQDFVRVKAIYYKNGEKIGTTNVLTLYEAYNTEDEVKQFSLTIKPVDFSASINAYDENGLIVQAEEFTKIRTIEATVPSYINLKNVKPSDSFLEQNLTITWTIPRSTELYNEAYSSNQPFKTMFYENTNVKNTLVVEDCYLQYYNIIKQAIADKKIIGSCNLIYYDRNGGIISSLSGCEKFKIKYSFGSGDLDYINYMLKQSFGISEFYSPYYTNNTIDCEVKFVENGSNSEDKGFHGRGEFTPHFYQGFEDGTNFYLNYSFEKGYEYFKIGENKIDDNVRFNSFASGKQEVRIKTQLLSGIDNDVVNGEKTNIIGTLKCYPEELVIQERVQLNKIENTNDFVISLDGDMTPKFIFGSTTDQSTQITKINYPYIVLNLKAYTKDQRYIEKDIPIPVINDVVANPLSGIKTLNYNSLNKIINRKDELEFTNRRFLNLFGKGYDFPSSIWGLKDNANSLQNLNNFYNAITPDTKVITVKGAADKNWGFAAIPDSKLLSIAKRDAVDAHNSFFSNINIGDKLKIAQASNSNNYISGYRAIYKNNDELLLYYKDDNSTGDIFVENWGMKNNIPKTINGRTYVTNMYTTPSGRFNVQNETTNKTILTKDSYAFRWRFDGYKNMPGNLRYDQINNGVFYYKNNNSFSSDFPIAQTYNKEFYYKTAVNLLDIQGNSITVQKTFMSQVSVDKAYIKEIKLQQTDTNDIYNITLRIPNFSLLSDSDTEKYSQSNLVLQLAPGAGNLTTQTVRLPIEVTLNLDGGFYQKVVEDSETYYIVEGIISGLNLKPWLQSNSLDNFIITLGYRMYTDENSAIVSTYKEWLGNKIITTEDEKYNIVNFKIEALTHESDPIKHRIIDGIDNYREFVGAETGPQEQTKYILVAYFGNSENNNFYQEFYPLVSEQEIYPLHEVNNANPSDFSECHLGRLAAMGEKTKDDLFTGVTIGQMIHSSINESTRIIKNPGDLTNGIYGFSNGEQTFSINFKGEANLKSLNFYEPASEVCATAPNGDKCLVFEPINKNGDTTLQAQNDLILTGQNIKFDGNILQTLSTSIGNLHGGQKIEFDNSFKISTSLKNGLVLVFKNADNNNGYYYHLQSCFIPKASILSACNNKIAEKNITIDKPDNSIYEVGTLPSGKNEAEWAAEFKTGKNRSIGSHVVLLTGAGYMARKTLFIYDNAIVGYPTNIDTVIEQVSAEKDGTTITENRIFHNGNFHLCGIYAI